MFLFQKLGFKPLWSPIKFIHQLTHVSQKESGVVHVNNCFLFFFFFFIFLKSNNWFAEALGQNSTAFVMPSPTASYTMAPMSTQAPQPTSKAPNDTTPTQSTTKKGETTPTTETKKPSKLIYQFLGASNHFWAYLSAMLISTSPFKAMTNQSIFFL